MAALGVVVSNQPDAAPLALASSSPFWRISGRWPPPHHSRRRPLQLHNRGPRLGLGRTEKRGGKQSLWALGVVVPLRLVEAAEEPAPGLRRIRRAPARPCSTWSSWRGWGGRRWLSAAAAAAAASERRRQRRRGKMAKTSSMQSTAAKTPPPPASISSLCHRRRSRLPNPPKSTPYANKQLILIPSGFFFTKRKKRIICNWCDLPWTVLGSQKKNMNGISPSCVFNGLRPSAVVWPSTNQQGPGMLGFFIITKNSCQARNTIIAASVAGYVIKAALQSYIKVIWIKGKALLMLLDALIVLASLYYYYNKYL